MRLRPTPPSDEPVIAGIILAAGRSRRIGYPKALLPFNDRTFVENLVDLLRGAGVDPIFVVVSEPDRAAIVSRLPAGVLFAVNPHPEGGPVRSLSVGLTALGGVGHAALVAPVDQPVLAPETLARLLDAWRQRRAPIVVPRYAGDRGHPVVLARSVFPDVFRASGGTTLRDVIDAHGDEVLDVDLDDPRVLLNVNNPADYRRLLDVWGLPHERHHGDGWEGFIARKSRSGRE